MIDQDIAVIDIDPVSWRNLGRMRKELIPDQRILTVLKDEGRIVAVFDHHRRRPVEIPDASEAPGELARRLFQDNGGAFDKVRVWEREALKEFAKEISFPLRQELDRDDYQHWARALRRTNYRGTIAEYPPYEEEKDPFGYPLLRSFVGNHDDSILFIAAFAGGAPSFNLILGVKNKKVNLLTTWDAFGGEELKPDWAAAEAKLAAKFGPVSAGMMIEKDALAAIFRAEKKEEEIGRARAAGILSGKVASDADIVMLTGLTFFLWAPMFSTVFVDR